MIQAKLSFDRPGAHSPNVYTGWFRVPRSHVGGTISNTYVKRALRNEFGTKSDPPILAALEPHGSVKRRSLAGGWFSLPMAR
jgi:hypothetical protein